MEKTLALDIANIVIGIATEERDHAMRMGDTAKAREWHNEISRQHAIITRLEKTPA